MLNDHPIETSLFDIPNDEMEMWGGVIGGIASGVGPRSSQGQSSRDQLDLLSLQLYLKSSSP